MARANVVVVGVGSVGSVSASHVGETIGKREPRDITLPKANVGKRKVRFVEDRIVNLDTDREWAGVVVRPADDCAAAPPVARAV